MARDGNAIGVDANAVGVAAEELAWKRFVLVEGGGARSTVLAHILGRSVAEIEAVKRSGAGGKRGWRSGDFDELFEKWNGRPPRDEEWPVPSFYKKRGSYEWQAPEVALLATLVGQMSVKDIAQALTARLQSITGDASAKRDRMAIQNQIARMGLMSSDFLGGIAAPDAARQVGSYQLVHQAIRRGDLKARKVGARLLIGHKAWAEWKAKIQAPPEGFVQLSTLKGPLSIASDKLSEYSRLGYVPNAVQFKPFGTKGMHTTQFGSWYVPQATADQLVADRREGRPMPWHGKPLLDNLKVTFRLWQERKHPKDCETCAQIWGAAGAPTSFDDYMKRYPALAHGAKRHLTMVWSPGMSVSEVAQRSLRSESHVRRAIEKGALAASVIDGIQRVNRTDAARWIARRCPTGEAESSWLSFASAEKQYLLSEAELVDLCDRGLFKVKIGTIGSMRGVRYVLRQQCADYRAKVGFSEVEAAARANVSVPQLRELLQGVNWRGAKGIPLSTVQAVIKRIQSEEGYTAEQAGEKLGAPVQWIHERIADGTVTVRRNKWGSRLYLTEPMVDRLRQALVTPSPRGRLDSNWIRLSDARHLAGVSGTTVTKWGEEGEVRCSREPNGMHYHQDDVRARARLYWSMARYRRAKLPAWLVAEQQAASQAADHTLSPSASRGESAATSSRNPWLSFTRVSLVPLIALRAQSRAAQGLTPETPRQIARLFAKEFVRIRDMELIAFEDLGDSGCAELSRLSSEFAGVPIDVQMPGQKEHACGEAVFDVRHEPDDARS